MSNALYELAFHQNIQDKLREEIISALERNENKLTYESIKNMKYLDKVVKGKFFILLISKNSKVSIILSNYY